MRRDVQLYIAGRQVDLADDSWILYNWTREELSNPTAVVNSSSHQITLPGTCRNNSVFGAAFRLDRRTILGIRYDGTNFDPMRKTPFMLYASDGTVLESGYCRLDEVNTHSRKHAYTLTLYGGLGSFFYALASLEDGTPRTLADLTWTGSDGDDVTVFGIAPEAATVQDAWGFLQTGTAVDYRFWNIVNFAPCYNGLPDEFDTTHAISTGEAFNNVPLGYTSDDNVYYSYKAGLDCCLLSFENAHTEWEMADLRWYLQRPVVSVKAFIAAVCDPRNNGGYTVTLDPTFFSNTNPYYADAWWTLPMIAVQDRTTRDGLANALAASKSPMRYLVDYCKHFGLLFFWDCATKTVRIVTRATFYGENATVLDISERVDRSQEMKSSPVLADKRWYQMGNGGKGEFVEQYQKDNGRGYAIQRIDTGYEFDAGTTILTDGMVFNEGAEVSESDLLFASAIGIHPWGVENVLLLPRYENVTAELWNGDESYDRVVAFYDWYSNILPDIVPDNAEYPNLDWLPKLQLHAAENKGQDGTDILLFFSGIVNTPSVTSEIRKPYYLTEDSPAMTDLAGGPCWDLTRSGIQRTSLPSFRRNVLSGRYITQSWEWGVPAVRPVPDIQYPNGAPTTLYAQWWKDYLADRYATDTRVLTCMADLRGLPVGQALLRRFYWLDGALWTLNAIRNHPFTSNDLTELELVRVQDKGAYVNGPGSLTAQFLDITPASESFQVKSRGEVLTFTVRSSAAWTLSFGAVQDWLVASAASGSAGTSVVTLTAIGNDSSARRSVTVSFTNGDGITKSFMVIQPPKTAGSLSLSPSSLTINAGGTGLRGASSRVTADGAWAVDDTTVPAWLRYNQSSAGITVYADANSGAARSAFVKVYLTGDTDTYAILAVTQEAGAGGNGGITLTDGNGNTSATAQSSGGTITLQLTVPDGDGWTLAASENWVTLSDASGTGNKAITVTIPSYSGNSDRQATITATRNGYSEGAVFYLIQAAPAVQQDSIELTRRNNSLYNNVEVDANSQSEGFDVKASGSWTVQTSTPWIHPQYGAWSGSGNATLWFSVDANTGAARTGIITATCGTASATFYVYQSGDGTYTLGASFNKSSIDASAQTLYLTIQASPGLAWSIDQISTGLSLSKTSGTGPDEVEVSVAAYTGSTYRDLSVRVKNAMYSLSATPSVRQNAAVASDYLRVTPFGTVNVGAVVTYQDFAVECSTSWRVQTSASGVTLSPSSGSGNGTVRVTFGANQSTDPRTIPLSFITTNGSGLSASATVSQAGAASQNVSVTPSRLDLPAGASSDTVQVTATGAWTASKSDSWITLSSSSGSAGSGLQITVGASVNNGSGARTGRVTFTCGTATATLVVNQSGQSSVDSIDAIPSSVTLAAANGSTGSTTVYASGSWKIATTLPAWLGASGPTSGSANGEVLTFTARSANNAEGTRTQNIRLELRDDPTVYKIVTVSQEGQTILYASPTNVSVFAYQGAGVTQITSNTGWVVSGHSEDIVIDDGDLSGTGDGSVSWYAKGNPTASARTLYIDFETTNHVRTARVLITQAAGVLLVSESAVTLAGNGDSVPIYVQASDPWTVQNVPAWLSVAPTAGTQSFTEVLLTVGANPNNFDRSATITFRNSGGRTVNVTVTQKGSSNGSLSLSPETVTLNSSAAATGSVTIVSSLPWTIEPSDDMLVSEYSGNAGSKAVTWDLGANYDENWREVVLTVRTNDGSIVKRLRIWQPGTNPDAVTFMPDVDSMTFYSGAAAVTKTVKMRVVSGKAWSAAGDAAWIGANKSSGAANTVVEVTFTPTISSSNVQIGHWTVSASGGDTRILTITTIPE